MGQYKKIENPTFKAIPIKVRSKLLLLVVITTFIGCKETQPSAARTPTQVAPKAKVEIPHRGGGFSAMVEKKLAEKYIGVFTSKGKQDGLFPLKSTGVPTQAIVDAANAFLGTLSEEERSTVSFALTDKEWRHWANVDNGMFTRRGISIKDMDREQRRLAFGLLQEALSAKGLRLAKDIMKTDQTLRELNNDDAKFDEELYFLTVMGIPSSTEPWGFQFEGHHLVINYFILGSQVVMTPTFMGGEPIITTTGKYKGNTIFQDEQNLGLKFMQSLNAEQQRKATLSLQKTGNNIEAEAFSDNEVVDFEGIKVSEMALGQKEDLLYLASQYINNMKEGHAKVKMEEVEKHIDDTYFGWRGNTADDAVFYYRLHSPVVLIEFDHQGPIGIKGKDRNPTRNHIHTIVRTPNGNDYGKDYLKQHLARHHR